MVHPITDTLPSYLAPLAPTTEKKHLRTNQMQRSVRSIQDGKWEQQHSCSLPSLLKLISAPPYARRSPVQLDSWQNTNSRNSERQAQITTTYLIYLWFYPDTISSLTRMSPGRAAEMLGREERSSSERRRSWKMRFLRVFQNNRTAQYGPKFADLDGSSSFEIRIHVSDGLET